jgi:hypothetical protein
MHRMLGLNGSPGTIPDVATGRMRSGSFSSRARLGARTSWSITVAPGRGGAPLRIVADHGLDTGRVAYAVFGRQSQLTRVAVRVDCGTGDGFYPAARDYARTLTPPPAGRFQPGAHDLAYWRRMAPAQLQFISHHLPA